MIEALRFILRRALNGTSLDDHQIAEIMAWAQAATVEDLKRAIKKAKAAMTNQLTHTQQRVLRAIRQLTERDPIPPTYRQIAQRTASSKTACFNAAQRLAELGFVQRLNPGVILLPCPTCTDAPAETANSDREIPVYCADCCYPVAAR